MPAALILIDLQNDFLPPDGALAVPGGDAILERAVYPLIDEGEWELVVASQDYHPSGHISFASRHNLPPFSSTLVSLPPERGGAQIEQELWPDHCVRETRGCEFETGVQERLDRLRASGGRVEVVQKGADIDLDAYSAFAIPLSDPNQDESPLTRLLLAAAIDTLVVVGLATDFCVRASVLAAIAAAQHSKRRWKVLVVREGVKGVFAEREEAVLKELEEAGAEVVEMSSPAIREFLRSFQ
ncbi:hypothetical protein JCM8097_008327 [Rhodosporidiobolus ruineniae]